MSGVSRILEVSLIRLQGCQLGLLASPKWRDLILNSTSDVKIIKKETIIYFSPDVGIRETFGMKLMRSPSMVKTFRGSGVEEVYPNPLITSSGEFPEDLVHWILSN